MPQRVTNSGVHQHLIKVLAAAVLGLALISTPAAGQTDADEFQPYLVNVIYTLEHWQNVHGGLARGSIDLAKLDLSAGANWRGSWGGVSLFARGFFANGHAVSGQLIGDTQGVSNIETQRAMRLFEMWGEWQPDDVSSTRLGLYDFNSEFDTLPTAQLFLNASHGIGKDVSQSGLMGPSIYPVTGLASRTLWNVTTHWTVKMAVMDGVPGDPSDSSAMAAVHLSRKDGALLAGEVAYSDETIHRIALGSWHYTSDFEVVGSGRNGGPAQIKTGNSGVYALLDSSVLPHEDQEPARLDAFLRLGYADPETNRFDMFYGGGIVYRGIINNDDHLGLSCAIAHQGAPYRRATALLSQQPARVAETNIEASWAIPVGNWLSVQPDLQYVINPNADPALRSDLVVGLRLQIALDALRLMRFPR